MADRDLVRKDQQSSSATSPRGTNYLLAIAINDYLHCSKLSNAVRDAEALIKLLTTRYHFDLGHVTFIKDSQANKKTIERAFLRLIKTITPQDNLIVYFSGHGRYDEHFGGNWVPVEAGTSDDDWTDYLSNDLVKSYLARIKSFHTFLIADSCFSGAFFVERSKEKNLASRVDTEPSRWGLTSGKKEIVSDGQSGKHSPFATALLDVLTKATDPPSVMQICTLVLEKVAANALQTPMGSALAVPGHQGGQMVLYFREDEERAWAAARATNTIKGYTDFHDKYPQSKYSDLGLDALDMLEEKEEWDKVTKTRQAALLRYIQQNPQGPYVPEARRLVDELRNATPSPASIEEKREEQQPVVVTPGPPPIIESKLMVPHHMILVKGGTFQMGEDKAAQPVTLSDFLIAKYPLTFDEYDAFCKATGRRLPDDDGWGRGWRPVVNVNWFDALDYCNWLSQQVGLREVFQINQGQVTANWQADGYRLPTEAEWEYAARGGRRSQGYKYAGSNDLGEVAWYEDNCGTEPPLIGQKKANELGIHDMSGNVLEWCWVLNSNFSIDVKLDPKRSESNTGCLARGGSWLDSANKIQVTFRNEAEIHPNLGFLNIGFRLAKAAVAL